MVAREGLSPINPPNPLKFAFRAISQTYVNLKVVSSKLNIDWIILSHLAFTDD